MIRSKTRAGSGGLRRPKITFSTRLEIVAREAYVGQNWLTSNMVIFMPKQSNVEKQIGISHERLSTSVKSRFHAVMEAAAHSGLLGEKSKRIGGRISPALIEQAKKHTGIETDTDLIEFALANVALDDEFAATFRRTRGTVDPGLKLGF